jgi:murein DD-endopeptidase MepM/ murein hydrolase activator NlpD
MGTTVVIRHPGGYTTRYCSLAAEVAVSAGQPVTMGQPIGAVGTTALMENALGDHVHFSVMKDDEPVDPMSFIQ